MTGLRLTITFVLAAFLYSATAHASEFSAPWEEKDRAIIIDPYEENPIDWEKLKQDKRVVAIIHRATIGFRKDALYEARKKEAIGRGYLWGSYHLGRSGDPVAQAKFYLEAVKPGDSELIALDIEGMSKKDMTISDAKKFVQEIASKTGRYPLLYTNDDTARFISRTESKSPTVFSKTPLWYARFKNTITDFPKGVWSTYTVWQFSSEINCNKESPCPYRVPGTMMDMDVNVFYGTAEELKAKWPFTKRSSRVGN